MPKPPRDGSGGKAAFDTGAVEAMQVLFGENFRQARTRAGLTQRDIEAHTGIKQAYISQIEGGKQNPTLGTMMILAHAVGKDVRVLLRQPTASTKPK
jgi:transcriptional regulator with XRE-family HTH domain